ncbi:hypothetical protein BaRGS_00007943 [Batillaria attramentaria]|uniref:Nuclear hormone receptor HR96 n=1 Tax=Batillaria attramentaria TaxID=370345 RepID=A0ABD0LMM6_9CAEN
MASIKPLFDQVANGSAHSSPSPQESTFDSSYSNPATPAGVSSADVSGEPVRKRHRMRDEKVCGVCGDKALGYNFNAITCESCKAFFRRNALKPKPDCLFQGNCVVDVRTRRFCPSCRINKCFTIGMKADMILDDAEKRARMEKVVENRNRRFVSHEKMEHPARAEPRQEDQGSSHSVLTTALLKSESPKEIPVRHYGLPKPSQARMFHHPPRELLPSDPQFYRRLTEEEKWTLNDISTAYQATIATLHGAEVDPNPPKANPSLNELINSTDETVRQLIRFVGKVVDFQQMRKDDQVSCLKNSVMQSVLMRSACVYILEKDVFLCSKGEVSTSFLKKAVNNASVYSAHVNFCKSMKSIILNNYTLWALAQILALFNPCGAAIIDREMLSTLQDKYIILLKHYLESEFSFTFATEYLVAIQDMLSDLKMLGEAYTTIIFNVNPTEIEPLLLEVFNLK